MISGYDMTNYSESFYEEHVWDTNWKVLAENFMESYHLPVCHAGTIGGAVQTRGHDLPTGASGF
jgi:phenylpropionate dioxygenase-like ring-hydroxylating dioxygenase large terminal subunit